MTAHQPTLFLPTYGGGWRVAPVPPAPPYQPRSATSRAGAKAIKPKAGGLRELLLSCLNGVGRVGLTIQEAAELMTARRGKPTKEGTICGRLHELRQQGRVVDSGRTRVGASGVACTVWVAAETRP